MKTEMMEASASDAGMTLARRLREAMGDAADEGVPAQEVLAIAAQTVGSLVGYCEARRPDLGETLRDLARANLDRAMLREHERSAHGRA